MKYFQLGGWSLNRRRWDDKLSKTKDRPYVDHKVNAAKVFNALTSSKPKSKFEEFQPDPEAEEIILTLGILESGASVLLLTWNQVLRICDSYRLARPFPDEAIHSSTLQSLSQIEFVDAEALTDKLRTLAPKQGKNPDRDTSQANKAYAWASMTPGAEPEGFKRGLFENVRVIREVVTGRIPSPSASASSSSLCSHDLHPPYAQFSLRRNINTILSRHVHLVAFSYILWDRDTTRAFEDRERSPDVLEVGLVRSRDGFVDLRAAEGAGSQVDFGWNAYKGQPGMTRKKFPNIITEERKSSLIGERLMEKLLQLSPRPDDDGHTSSRSKKGINPVEMDAEHLFILVHDEAKFRAIFLDLGVDLLKGCFEAGDEDASGDGRGPRGWTYTHGTDVLSELKALLRDDSYSGEDHTSYPGPSRSANGHYGRGYRNRDHPASRDRSYRYPQGKYDDFQSNGQYQDRYPSSSSSHAYVDSRGPSVVVKREPGVKRERLDDNVHNSRPLKRQKMEDGDVYDTTSDEDELERGRGGSSPRRKVKKEESTGTGTKSAPPRPTSIHIHVLDLKTLFTVANGSSIGAQSVQYMARELQKGHGGVQLHGQLGEKEYSAGWDAELMLSIFQKLVDGGTVDDQKASALSRREADLEEANELRRIQREEQQREEKERQERRPELNEDRDPNHYNVSTRISGVTNVVYGGLGEDWEDYGESDDE